MLKYIFGPKGGYYLQRISKIKIMHSKNKSICEKRIMSWTQGEKLDFPSIYGHIYL